jgi:cysteine desulfurase/selenocysteine lyase
MDPREFREQFPVVTRTVYLNAAAVGPVSSRARDAAVKAIAEQADHGSGIFTGYEAALARTRDKVARLIGADAGEIAFVRNTVEALSVVASGLPWRAGDNVVASALEFSGNAYPWLNLARFGVSCRFVPSSDGAVDIDRLLEAADERTQLITVSLVQFSNGFRVDIDRLGEACQRRGIRLMVDAIQGVGVVTIDVRRAAVDFLACGAHKWLCAPLGSGFLYVRAARLPEISLTEIGHSSVVPVPQSFTDYRFTLRPDARRFESGVTSYASILGLEAALDLVDAISVARLRQHICALTARLVEQLRPLACRVQSVQPTAEAAGIVAFMHPRWASDVVATRLAGKGIIVSVREGAVRVSVHGYNTSDEIDALIAALA